MLTIAELEIAARINGMDYGKYSFLLEHGFVMLPPIDEIRARLVTDKKSDPEKYTNKVVICYDLKGELVASYENVKAAAEMLGTKTQRIYDCCNGRAKTSRGFQWRYAEDDPPGAYVKPKSQPIELPKKKPPQERVCVVCGKIFQGREEALYCSEECRRQSKYARERARRAAKPKEVRTLICEYCGKPFTVTGGYPTKYCSIRCRETHNWKQREARKKEQRKPQNRK